MRSRRGKGRYSSSARQRSVRASRLPMHKQPKLVTVETLPDVVKAQLWTFRPRVLGLNELSKRWLFHREKSQWKAALWSCLNQHPSALLLAHKRPVTLSVKYFEPSVSRDPSNVDGGAMKALLDALVECGILPNDNWKWIKPPHTYCWVLEKTDPRVELTIREA